jgi:hypothetical protein
MRPGQRVVAIYNPDEDDLRVQLEDMSELPVKDEVYTVTNSFMYVGVLILHLKELDHGNMVGYQASGFRIVEDQFATDVLNRITQQIELDIYKKDILEIINKDIRKTLNR